MIKHMFIVAILLIFNKYHGKFYTISNGRFLTTMSPKSYSCGPAGPFNFVLDSSFFTYIRKSLKYISNQIMVLDNQVIDTRNYVNSNYDFTIAADNYDKVDITSDYKFGYKSTHFVVNYGINSYYNDITLMQNIILKIFFNNDTYKLILNLDIVKSDISVTNALASNNLLNSETCLNITIINPCKFLQPSTAFRLTLPPSHPNNPILKIHPLSNFNLSKCEVKLNGTASLTTNCSVNGDALIIYELLQSSVIAKNISLSICNITMSDTNTTNSMIELLNTNNNKPGTVFASSNFSYNVTYGLQTPKILTLDKSLIGFRYYIDLSIATVKNCIINPGNRAIFDFINVPHDVTSIEYEIIQDKIIKQSGFLKCFIKTCEIVIDREYNLINNFTIKILAANNEFNTPYTSYLILRFANLSSSNLVSQNYPMSRIYEHLNASVEENDVGISSSITFVFKNMLITQNIYNIVFSFGTYAIINPWIFDKILINTEKISKDLIFIDSITNIITIKDILLDDTKNFNILIKGIYIGPFDSGWNTILISFQKQNKIKYLKTVSLYSNINSINIKSATKRKSNTKFILSIEFEYVSSVYTNHDVKIGMPNNFIVDEKNWLESTNIPHNKTISLIYMKTKHNNSFTYWKLSNLLFLTSPNKTYLLNIFFTIDNVEEKFQNIELSVYTILFNSNRLQNNNIKNQPFMTSTSIIIDKCPFECDNCNITQNICLTCNYGYIFNSITKLCEKYINIDSNNQTDQIGFIFGNKTRFILNKFIISLSINCIISIIVLGIIIKIFYYKKIDIYEFYCSLATIFYSASSYAFLLTILAELKWSSDKTYVFLIPSSIICNVVLNVSVSVYILIMKKKMNTENCKKSKHLLKDALFIVICAFLGAGLHLLFGFYDILNVTTRFYFEHRDLKNIYNINIFVKWIVSFNILLFSASTVLIYYTTSFKTNYIYVYFIYSFSVFILYLITIIKSARTKNQFLNQYDTTFNKRHSDFVVIKQICQSSEYLEEDSENISCIPENIEIKNYLDRIQSYERMYN